jgi:hypothetical protein
MAKICHHRGSPIFPFDDIDESRLQQKCFNQSVLKYLVKYIWWHWGVASNSFYQVIRFGAFALLNVLYYESCEIVLHPSD